jgi:Na+-translocating ferredoxin:NAD+ oxidoreductase RnfA subunit
MKELILLVLGFVLVNNYALTAYFGLTPLLGFASRREKILVLGLSVTGVMLVASAILWLLRGLIPAWAQILCGVVVVLALVYLLQVIDANVFSYMHDFEIADDMALDVRPSVITPNTQLAFNPQPAFGLSVGLKF